MLEHPNVNLVLVHVVNSNRQIQLQPNNEIEFEAHFNTEADLVFSTIQFHGPQFIHPNAALDILFEKIDFLNGDFEKIVALRTKRS